MFTLSNLVALGCIQGLILSVYCLVNSGPSRFLGAYVLLLSINMCVSFYLNAGYYDASMWLITGWEALNSYLLLGPIMLAFVIRIIEPQSKLLPQHCLHFIPFLAYCFIFIFDVSSDYSNFIANHATRLLQLPDRSFSEQFSVIPLLSALHFCCYLGYGSWRATQFWLLHGKPKVYKQVAWLVMVLGSAYLMMASIATISVISIVTQLGKPHSLLVFGHLSTVITMFAMTFLIIKIGKPTRISTHTQGTKTDTLSSATSVNRSKMLDMLDWELTTHKPYLKPDFKQIELANRLNISRHQLSEFLSFHPAGNFHTLINELRVKAVIEQMKTRPKSDNLITIAFECGFNSKSSFNNVFKKYTHQPPSQYRKTLCGSNKSANI